MAPNASGVPPQQMPFIVTLNSGKADPSTRRLIRSHARQTRNRKAARAASSGQKAASTRLEHGTLDEAVRSYTPQVPSRVGGDLSFTGIVGDIEESILLNIIKVQPIATRLIFPLRTAMGYQAAAGKRIIYPIASDPAVLHVTAYAIEGLIDTVLRRQEAINPRGMLHLQRGLVLLRDRLAGKDPEARVSDATIAVVLKLASVAHFDGDYHASRQHMEGIRRMVDLRGGVDEFRGKDLFAEILRQETDRPGQASWLQLLIVPSRYDLAMALLHGEDPLFYVRPGEPPPPYPPCLVPVGLDSPTTPIVSETTDGGPVDDELAVCWRAMRRFCLLADLTRQKRRPMHPEIIHETTAAVMYRLLRMRLTPGSADEALRCGLLAFSHHVFIQWRDIKPSGTRFAASFRAGIVGFEAAQTDSPRLVLWLLMVGAIAVFGEADGAWLSENLERYARRCRVTRWSEMRTLLRSMMWIDLLDEEQGRAVFQGLVS